MISARFEVNDPELRARFLGHTLFEALASLDGGSAARWGGMTAQQMVEHLVWSFELSTGQARVDCTVPTAERERLKPFLHGNRAMPHDVMNPALAAGLPPSRYASLTEAKAALRREADRFLHESPVAAGAAHTHPVFGPPGGEEWHRSHFKHVYHHLAQFGLIETEPPR